jgi:hypothetical protein
MASSKLITSSMANEISNGGLELLLLSIPSRVRIFCIFFMTDHPSCSTMRRKLSRVFAQSRTSTRNGRSDPEKSSAMSPRI